MNHEKLILDYYYSPDTGFIGVRKLYEKLKQVEPMITMKEIKEVLNRQEIVQVTQKKNKTGSFVPTHIKQEFQIDIIYLDHPNLNEHKYALTAIDIFSKKATCVPMKRKDENETCRVFNIVLERLGTPEMVYADEGKEFDNTKFRNLLKDHKIELILTLTHAPVIERFNKTLKEMLQKYLVASKSKTITNVLPRILKNYNDSYHRSIKMTPNEVIEANSREVHQNLLDVSNRIHREPLRVGDKVRTQKKAKTGDKMYKPQWSTVTHTIESKDTHGRYTLDGVKRKYLRAHLMKVGEVQTQKVEADIENTKEGRLKKFMK